MKKIISVTGAVLFLAGTASADVTIKLASRTRPSLYTRTTTYAAENNTTSKTLTFDDENNYDTLSLAVKKSFGGVSFKWDLYNNPESRTEIGATSGVEAAGNMVYAFDEQYAVAGGYAGWLNFGNLRILAGNHDDRFTKHYRTGVLAGASNTAYFGVSQDIIVAYSKTKSTSAANTKLGKTFLYDFSNFGRFGTDCKLGLFADYTLNKIADGKLILKLGALANNYRTTDSDEHDYVGAGFAAEIDYASSAIDLQAVFKNPTEHTFGFGLYANYKGIKNLNTGFGLTYGFQKEYDEPNASAPTDFTGKIASTTVGWNALALDFRAFYKVISPLTLGLVAKFTGIKVDTQTSSDSVSDEMNTALETILTGTYKLNNTVSVGLGTGLYIYDLDKHDDFDTGENYIKVRPEVTLTAGKGSECTLAFEWQELINDGDADDWETAKITRRTIKIPVTIRIQL